MTSEKPFLSRQEIDLKTFGRKLHRYRKFFFISISFFVILALGVIFLSTPKYEVSTSLIIDATEETRKLGESQFIEGGVDLIKSEKNLFNEVAILTSYNLLKETVTQLGIDVTYHTPKELFNSIDLPWNEEQYGYFPFKVVLDRTKSQLQGLEFTVIPLENDQFELLVEGDKFQVYNPVSDSKEEFKFGFSYSNTHTFGEAIGHKYFNFTIHKPEYELDSKAFENKSLSFIVHDINQIVEDYRQNLQVDNIDIKASIFRITSKAALVDKEKAFLNQLTSNYIKNQVSSRNSIAADKEEFIRKQLQIITDSLADSEVVLESFKRNESAINLGATANNALLQSQGLQTQAGKLRIRVQYYNSLIQSIQNNRNEDDFSIPTTMGINDPLLSNNIMELNRLYAERSRKRFYVTGNNEEITILNGQINESADLLLSNLQSAIKAARVELGGINAQLSNYGEVINELPTQQKELLTIERKNTLYNNLFNYLSQELAKTGIAKAESTADSQVLDEARMVGTGPVAPQKTLLLTAALLMGTLLPFGWVVLFAPDENIENIKQIISNTTIPIISNVILQNKTIKGKKSEVSQWMLKESFRDLYANLRLKRSQDDRVIAISSTMPQEGKSYISIHLGKALAEAGHKTIVIDMDMRKPGLVQYIKKDRELDLSHFLQDDHLSAQEIIQDHDTVTNLSIIMSSVVEGNVQPLLSSSRMRELMDHLKKEYDYILFDTPALGLVSDIYLLWELIDLNLFVLRRGTSKIKFIHDFESKVPTIGKVKNYLVYNGAEQKSHKYGYGDKYGS